MIKSGKKIIRENKLKNKAGGFTNESRFGGWERELREKKTITVPCMTTGARIIIRQGWNKLARDMDILRITAINEKDQEVDIVAQREDFEQAFAFMAQGDELLKWTKDTIKSPDRERTRSAIKFLQRKGYKITKD